MSKFERKVTKIGNSYGITISVDLLKESGISYGDDVQLELKEGKSVVEKKKEIKLPDGLDHKFMEILNDVVREHSIAYKSLVDK